MSTGFLALVSCTACAPKIHSVSLRSKVRFKSVKRLSAGVSFVRSISRRVESEMLMRRCFKSQAMTGFSVRSTFFTYRLLKAGVPKTLYQ